MQQESQIGHNMRLFSKAIFVKPNLHLRLLHHTSLSTI
jgi:hypothetical protein